MTSHILFSDGREKKVSLTLLRPLAQTAKYWRLALTPKDGLSDELFFYVDDLFAQVYPNK